MKLLVYGLIILSQQLLLKVKTGEDTRSLQDSIASMPASALTDELNTEDEKLAFWLNIYNANIQLQLKDSAAKYTNRTKFFKTKSITVAGKKLSFDDIEHGILRHSKSKLSLGYFNKWFPGKFERQHRLQKADYRIHFALNCGAASCPPIAFYKPEIINKQLDLATNNYLQQEVAFDSTANTVTVPKLMLWFKGDFGGKRGVYSILHKMQLIPANARPKIKYKEYSWTLMLNNYSQ
ncbi:MAG: DUF547 domain-containing protein [Sphingobacteriales bacterium JAD_PAG50586_3]|nr:MAG: DUF547 domain-containing protein [Sphingobacteriales bacterium JAD_PAG50586_3]